MCNVCFSNNILFPPPTVAHHNMKTAYKPIRTDTLSVCQNPPHCLHIECYGNPYGTPILCVHGGPGGESDCQTVLCMGLFDLDRLHVVFFDQRGCGQSTPFAECNKNTPFDTVRDMERIRKYMGWKQLVLFGGSYGTSVILLYTIRHPQRVLGYILRSVYLMDEVINKLLQRTHPLLWKRLQRTTQQTTLRGISTTVSQRIRTNHKTKKRCVQDWCALEDSALPTLHKKHRTAKQRVCVALLEAHYEANNFFLSPSFDLLMECQKMRGVPGLIVHGDADIICPIENARALHKVLNVNGGGTRVRLVVVKSGGHSAQQRPMRKVMRREVPIFLASLHDYTAQHKNEYQRKVSKCR